MFKHLLVPLDGSLLAEAALPAAAYLADKLEASVTLVHIIERAAPQAVHGERHLTDAAEARAYLEQVAQKAFPPGVRVKQHVHTTEVADVTQGIVAHVTELAPDLIVMCTHGRGGLRGLLLGSIAQRVVSHGTIPVLLIQPHDHSQAQPFTCQRLLVPLDSAGSHIDGLTVATELAKPCAAELHLLMVIPTADTLSGNQAAAGRLLPGATRIMLEMACTEAENYLCDLVTPLEQQGLPVQSEVKRGDPAEVIVETAQLSGADMIVLGTHGKAGLDAFYAGSIAPRIASRATQPLLLVPLP